MGCVGEVAVVTDSSKGAGRRRRRFWGPLLGFLLGVALTIAVTVGLLGLGDDAEPDAAPSPTVSAPVGASDGDGDGDGDDASGEVPAPCVEAARQNQAFGATMDEAAVAIRDEDAAALAEVLDLLQENRPAMDEASERCLDLAGVAGATPQPTETP